MQRKDELDTWLAAAVILVLFAVSAFLIQFVTGRLILDYVLEICIFYVPAFMSVLLYLYLRLRH